MKLNVQIYSLVYSFFFGWCFYFLLDLFNKVVNKLNFVLKIILSFVFVILIASIYFLILLFINNGIVHIYFLLSILLGYFFAYKAFPNLFTHLRRK